MKHLRIFCAALLFIVLGVQGLKAQSSLKGMSLNGSTGLYSIPSARISWERTTDLGLDLGYQTIVADGDWYATHIAKIGVSLFKWVEVSVAFDLQPDGWKGYKDEVDFIGGLKIQLPLTKTAIAFGDFGYYWVADRQGRAFKRLNELYATTGQVGFLATQRVDGKLILPEAIKVLKMKSA